MTINLNFRRGVFAFASIFFIVVSNFLYGQEPDSVSASPELNAELVAAGETLFKNNCQVCHEILGEGARLRVEPHENRLS